MKNEGTISSHSKVGGAFRRFSKDVIVATALLLFCSGVLLAQTTTSTIEGTVRDANGALVAGAQVKASSSTLATERTAVTNSEGFYRIVSLPAGTYTLSVSQTGFSNNTSQLELTLNRTATVDVTMQVGAVGGDVVTVGDDLPLLNTDAPSTGATITPRQIEDLPVNGRNYLDLLQLVPGTAINRHVDPEGDNANPVLGERSGNNNFFIDGHPNKDSVTGGPAAQFNQETIAEFQVLTTGYKAEFGQASGAIVNVITKSGGNGFHGVASLFYRHDALDSSNSIDPARTEPPYLRRSDYSAALGGPIIKDKFFFFASAERITEDRLIDFNYPTVGNAVADAAIRNFESAYDYPSPNRETRAFLKLNQQFGRHSLSQEVNYTNLHIKNYAPLSAGNSTPSTRNDSSGRNLLLAFGDTMLLGDSGAPWIVTLRGAYRGEPSDREPSHPEAGGGNLWDPFIFPTPCPASCLLLSPVANVSFGNSQSPSFIDQRYVSFSANANKRFGDHDVKFGWNFLRTKVDGLSARTLQNQLFATPEDFVAFAPVHAGVALLLESGGLTPEDDEIHITNNYNAFFFQDDWRIRNNLTVSAGLRWDHDSEFEATKNFAPRVGATWSPDGKTVIRGNIGIFYDQFRLGLARNVPQFGGANQVTNQVLQFPRGIYGSPSFVSSVALLLLGNGPCFSSMFVGNLTDAQIAGAGCPLAPSVPFIGVDRLNNVVAPGNSPIPANSVITVDNVQALSGLSPAQYIAQANTAIGFPGFFYWGPFGLLTNAIIPPFGAPQELENVDQIPNTLGFSVGVQRQLTKDIVFEADYHHREMRDMLGIRVKNVAFRARVGVREFDPPGSEQIISYGPYFDGKYDALVLALNKQFSNRYMFGASYSFSKATDNSRGVFATPSDSFIGIATAVTDPGTATCAGGQTNQNGSFTACNGNFVPQAGQFWNGPDQDKGPSDLALDHVFQMNGMVALPWDFQVSGIFRAQSGFHFSRSSGSLVDPDGDANTNGVDVAAGRNAFSGPAFVNFDFRVGKQFKLGDRVKLDLFYEMFNVFNRQNPASINTEPGTEFGRVLQVLPGREGQIGVRVAF